MKIQEFAIGNNEATFVLKNTVNNIQRCSALVYACKQNCNLVGVYVIGITYNNEAIHKIAGTDATRIRNGDNITITFNTDSVWASGYIIAPKQFLDRLFYQYLKGNFIKGFIGLSNPHNKTIYCIRTYIGFSRRMKSY